MGEKVGEKFATASVGGLVLGDAVGSEVEGAEVDLEGSGVMGPVVMAGWLGSDAVGAEIGAAVGPRVLGSEMLGSDVGPTVGGRVGSKVAEQLALPHDSGQRQVILAPYQLSPHALCVLARSLQLSVAPYGTLKPVSLASPHPT